MEKKIRILIEVLFVIILCGYYIVKVMIPEYRERYGSSDVFVRTKNYQNLFEVKIDEKIHFAFLLNDKKQIYHILFLEPNAKALYNRGIENHSIEDALGKAVPILIERDYLSNSSLITITRYGDSGYSEFYTSLSSYLDQYQISCHFMEKKSTLEALASTYNIQGSSNDEILKNLDLYSKETIGFLSNTSSSSSDKEMQEYSLSVYKKIDHYVTEKGLDSFSKDNPPFPIQMIPADEEEQYFPSGDSWYSYEDGKITAYIEFIKGNNRYGYCYQGSKDSMKKGEC